MTKPITIVSENFLYDYGSNSIPPSINSPPNKNFFKDFVCKIVEIKKPVKEYLNSEYYKKYKF